MSDGPEDWTEEMIGTPDKGRPWSGLLEDYWLLTKLAPPEELDRAAQLYEGLAERTGAERHADEADWLRACADLVRYLVGKLEDEGFRWNWEKRAVVGPKDGTPGLPRESHTLAVGAAWEQVDPPRNRKNSRETRAAVRERLADLLPADELTDAKLKSRITEYLKRTAGEK